MREIADSQRLLMLANLLVGSSDCYAGNMSIDVLSAYSGWHYCRLPGSSTRSMEQLQSRFRGALSTFESGPGAGPVRRKHHSW
jgi:hypothetical protein